jgi:hypothetical protein
VIVESGVEQPSATEGVDKAKDATALPFPTFPDDKRARGDDEEGACSSKRVHEYKLASVSRTDRQRPHTRVIRTRHSISPSRETPERIVLGVSDVPTIAASTERIRLKAQFTSKGISTETHTQDGEKSIHVASASPSVNATLSTGTPIPRKPKRARRSEVEAESDSTSILPKKPKRAHEVILSTENQQSPPLRRSTRLKKATSKR